LIFWIIGDWGLGPITNPHLFVKKIFIYLKLIKNKTNKIKQQNQHQIQINFSN